MHRQVLPWVLDGVVLGSDVLEVGPGPGVTTEYLRTRVPRLTCVERDRALASRLGTRMPDVTVTCEDATAMSFPDAAFDGAVCLTMLHHLPSPAHQDRLFSELGRVLRAGAPLVGLDSLDSLPLRMLHAFDTFVPVPPDTLCARLERHGFERVDIDVRARDFRFHARRA